jgi:hypothetical protein
LLRAKLLEQSLALERQLANKPGIAHLLCLLSGVVGMGGDRERSYRLGEEGLALFREFGDQDGIAGALYALGLNQSDLDAGKAMLLESLAIYRQLRNKGG